MTLQNSTVLGRKARSARSDELQAAIAHSERKPLVWLAGRQELWITVAVVVIAALVGFVSPAFLSGQNIGNVSQNFAFIALMTIGITPVMMSGGIDISVGSMLGFCGVIFGLTLSAGNPLWVGMIVAAAGGVGLGAVNGFLVAFFGLPAFIVTLGMLSAARSLSLIVSSNKVVYAFGPDEKLLAALGSGWTFGLPNVVWAVVLSAIVLNVLLTMMRWGRWVAAVGGNEEAARAVGVPVRLIKLSTFVFSGFMCSVTAIFLVGWLGSVTNALGTGEELRVIAAAVIGGASLSGGAGTAYGAIIGSVLIETIRNALLLAGVNPFWQGLFVGAFIVFAVLLEKAKTVRVR